MRRLTALPREAYRQNPEALKLRQASLIAAKKNTAIVHRRLVLATCAQIRREIRSAS